MTSLGNFKLVKSGTSGALCFAQKDKKHAGSLWNGKVASQDECKSKCVFNEECKFYSYWHGSRTCQFDSVCNHWGSSGNSMISTYERIAGRPGFAPPQYSEI